MKPTRNIILFILALFACDTEQELIQERIEKYPLPGVKEINTGELDLSKFVAIGDAMTAGYMDGALYTDGQNHAFPNLLASHFKSLNALTGEFKQPDINSTLGFNTTLPNPIGGEIYGRYELDLTIPGPRPTSGGDLIGTYTGTTSELNNFGVPGIITAQLLTPFTGAPENSNPAYNPFYARFASDPGSSTLLGDALSGSPSLYSLWVGLNDILGYAATGGDGSMPITSISDFQTYYQAILTQLAGSGTQGVVLNLPPVLVMPYFRAVPYNPVPLTQEQADQLNAGYQDYNNGLAAAQAGGLITEEEKQQRTITFINGQNAIVINDEYLTDLSAMGMPNYRQTNSSDLLPLSTASALATGTGTMTAAEDKHILTIQEQVEIITAHASFNQIIKGIVDGINTSAGSSVIGFVNIESLYADIAGLNPNQAALLGLSTEAQAAADGTMGIRIKGFEYQPDFSPNGLYSTDGIHMNPKGHAVIGNKIIEVLNQEFGASIPQMDIDPMRTIIIF